MILGETVDKLGLTQQAKQRVLPVVGVSGSVCKGAGRVQITLGELQIPQVEGKSARAHADRTGSGKIHRRAKTLRQTVGLGKRWSRKGSFCW